MLFGLLNIKLVRMVQLNELVKNKIKHNKIKVERGQLLLRPLRLCETRK